MKAKTLLIAAAALVAGVISSEAQTVYSVNVVGYVNVATVVPSQYILLSNPLDNGTNKLNDLLGSAPSGSSVQIWNGTSFAGSTKLGANWSPNSSVLPGSGFFLRTSGLYTNTFVGSVVAPSGGSVTNTLAGGLYSLVGSAIPYADNLNGTNLNLAPGSGSSIQIWNGTSYAGSTRLGANWSPNSAITVAQGFFIRPVGTYNWIQKLQ